jgi:hypothetical protein
MQTYAWKEGKEIDREKSFGQNERIDRSFSYSSQKGPSMLAP